MTKKNKSKAASRGKSIDRNRLMISRRLASIWLKGGEHELMQAEWDGLLPIIRKHGTVYYLVDDFLSILPARSDAVKELRPLQQLASEGEVLSVTRHGASVLTDDDTIHSWTT